MLPNHRLYVGTIGNGLWRSTDGGDSFQRACEGMFVECHVRALAVHPGDPKRLLLGTEQGLFRSDNGADSWSRVDSPLNGLQIWALLFAPHDPQLILAGTCPSRLFRTEDGGRTWQEPSVDMVRDCPRIMHTRVTTLRADPATAGDFWTGIEIDGLRHSRDGGQTWQEASTGLSSRDIHDLAITTHNGKRRLLAATNNDLNMSEDEGRSWRPLQIDQFLPWKYCRALAVPCGRQDEVLLGHGNGPPGDSGVVARSTDGGATWRAAEMPGRGNSTIWNFAVNAAGPELIYASSISGELYRSTDRGASWEKLQREFGEIRALAWTV
jgi:photosystem II stability/assembly factor-like uncharacterized protein